MSNLPSITIVFFPENWTPLAVYYNASTDEETVKLQKIAVRMLANFERSEDEN